MTAAAAPFIPDARAIAAGRAVIAQKSRSFALASRLLPPAQRDDVALVYAFCRHVDDAIDLAPVERRAEALAGLRAAVDAVFAGRATGVDAFDGFAAVARARAIPRAYVEELIEGMAMDVARVRYDTLEALLLYAHRVAGVVGLLLCHVMGLSDPSALPNAAHLGFAMQLTNVCRDVAEDLDDGRLYLPHALLGLDLDGPPPPGSPARAAVCRAVRALLDEADRFYKSADAGFAALPFRCALAARAARYLYAEIGHVSRLRGCDPFVGRAVVSPSAKVFLLARALVETLAEQPRRLRASFRPPERTLVFPGDVLPVSSSSS